MQQPRKNTAGWFFLIGGLVLGAIGLLVGFMEFLAIVDPVGTKMADDSDAFGDPYISPFQHLALVIVTLLILAGAAFLFFQASKRLAP